MHFMRPGSESVWFYKTLIKKGHIAKLPAQSRSITNAGLGKWWFCLMEFKDCDSLAALVLFFVLFFFIVL